jgi:predicted metalloprotease
MRWSRGHASTDVIDRRGQSAGIGGLGGLIGWLPLLLRHPLGWVVLAVILVALVIYNIVGDGAQRAVGEGEARADRSETVEFVSFVLDDVQNSWQRRFEARGEGYPRAKLVLFDGSTPSACGFGSAASGPFYCPRDGRVFLDLSFFAELEQRFGAPGDFAQAYVVAHEIGHHVQHQRGLTERVRQAPNEEREGAGGMDVRLELQADCFAGIWAHSTQQRQLLEQGDIDEGLEAAAAIGDDRLQRQAQGHVNPESWTHGSSEQRARWFKRGYESDNEEACDTFSAAL